jgi:anaerobic magnesium-protoporphyrin IX monomethyl ester cyclase
MKKTDRRVVLFFPSYKFGGSVQSRTELPLSLLSIGTPLDRAGYTVRIIDQRIEPDWKAMLSEELDKNPVCVGVSSMTGPQIQCGLEASRLVRAHGCVPVVWGGIHPTLLPAQTVANEHVDIVVQGEGEETFFELVRALETGHPLTQVKGIWFKEGNETRSTGQRPPLDLNQQPPLSYHLVNLDKYLIRVFGTPHISLETSRGCPFRCGYCYNTPVYKGRWRGLTAEETLRRVRILARDYGVKGILFTDDNFFGEKSRALEILRRIREEDHDVVVSKIDAHVSQFARLSDAEMDILKAAQCKMVMMGIESGSARILDMLNKRIKIPDLLYVNRRLCGSGIRPHYFLMMGFPTETRKDLSETLALQRRLSGENPDGVPRYNIFTPYPGTPIFDIAVEHGFVPPSRLEDWVSLNYRTVNKGSVWLSERQKKTIRMLHFTTLLAQRNNFIKPYKKTPLWVRAIALLYYPVACFRVRCLFPWFPVELKMAELLGVYPKQS